MAKPKLELKQKTDEELKNFADAIVTAMTGNANFATPAPTLASITALATTLLTRLQAITTLETQLRAAYTNKETARMALEKGLTYLGNYVEGAADGDVSKIESAGMSVRGVLTPIGIPSMVTSLAASFSDFEGQVDLSWDPVYGAKGYEVDRRLHADAAAWTRALTSTGSQARVPDLESGELYAFRVRAIGAAGPGPWSDEAVKRAP